MSQENERYLSRLIAQRTDLRQLGAEKRVADAFAGVQTALEEMEATVRVAADETRETYAYGALWMFVTLLISAFLASLTAVIGGRQRDAWNRTSQLKGGCHALDITWVSRDSDPYYYPDRADHLAGSIRTSLCAS